MQKTQENPAGELIYGRNPAAERLKSGGVDTVLLADGMEPRQAGYYVALARQAGAVVKRVPAEKLTRLTGTDNHQGVAVRAAAIEYSTLQQLLDLAAKKNRPPFFVLCDGVEDPHNLGAILRSALLCGAQGAIIPKRGGAAVTPTVMKASAGAASLLPVARVSNLGEAIRRLKEQNIFVYCADMDGVPLKKNDLSGAIALVLGSEGSGVSPLTRKLCDGAIALDMANAGGVDSFNVSVAAGIIMYEIMARRADDGNR